MKTQEQIEVNFASSVPSGYGHRKIIVELLCDGNSETFSAITSNMAGYDFAMEFEGDEKYDALYRLIECEIEDEVNEWLETI